MTNSTSRHDAMPPPIRSRDDRCFVPSLKTWRIADLEFELPVVQAALSGYSDWPMRVIARRLGAPYTLAEVLIDRFVNDLKDRHKTRHHLLVKDDDHPVGAQLMGANPVDFEPAAKRLVAAGFDVIDINFGCPVKSAVGGCRGGYHLSQPHVALEIVDRVRAVVPPSIPVTLKMRRGIDDSNESLDFFYHILDGAFARGVAAITVHGRTVEQKYVGPSNWDFLRAVKQHVGHRTIIGSGDAFTAEACVEMLAYTGVDAVSAARGAIGNPWIFQQVRALLNGDDIPNPGLAEQARVLRSQWQLCEEIYDARSTLATMRKFGIKFAKLHPEEAAVRSAFAAVNDATTWNRVLDEHYQCITNPPSTLIV